MGGSGRTIYIAGAGIGGLTLALALAKFGATVVVLERARSLHEIGAGIQLSPNARRILNQLGLDRQLKASALEPTGIDVVPFRARGALTTLRLGAPMTERFGAPYAVMHRADLVEILYRACKRFANIDMLFGVRSFDVASHAKGISTIIEDDSGTARSGRGFAFVGADGVHSRTRVRAMGGPDATYSGSIAWRATVSAEVLRSVLVDNRVTLLLAPGYHAVCYPLPHRRQVNVALFCRASELEAFGPHALRQPKLPWSLLRSHHFDTVMAAARDAWGSWPLSTVQTDTWHAGAVGLVGDAAHAMLPHQAQGAAMAIEDAAVLAPMLVTEPDAESAFLRYAALRRARVERVRRLSRANGLAFHMEWPFTLGRDAIITLQGPDGHLRRLAWLYGYNATPEPHVPSPGTRATGGRSGRA